eukprot:8324168-Pyramimonas_sp.AAC.1
MCSQPTRANKHQAINLKTLGDDKLKWKKMQQAVEKEWNTWCKYDASNPHIRSSSRQGRPGQDPKLQGGLDR